MPGFDKSGPEGRGPLTGRQMGSCGQRLREKQAAGELPEQAENAPVPAETEAAVPIYGRGMAFRRGGGRGLGRGFGRGAGRRGGGRGRW